MNKKAIIIGSGIAGLALSVRLKVKGYDVHVFEKNESYGGKLSEFKLGEYRYDFGPKLFTLPELLVDLFKISNQNIDDYIKYKKIEVGCKYFWEDGKVFNAYADKQKLIKEIVSEFDTDKKKLNNYLNRSKKKFDLTRTIFLEKSLHKAFNIFFYLSF
jgi:phytoene dehydrogenase-like protein